jgi:hypothetical protein
VNEKRDLFDRIPTAVGTVVTVLGRPGRHRVTQVKTTGAVKLACRSGRWYAALTVRVVDVPINCASCVVSDDQEDRDGLPD